MNQQIEQLALQAGFNLHNDVIDGHDFKHEIEKLAELIVKECISINRQRMFSDYEGDSHRVAHNNALLCANSDMFEHFGVEDESIKVGAEIHAGDGGYEIGTQEAFDEFIKKRNAK